MLMLVQPAAPPADASHTFRFQPVIPIPHAPLHHRDLPDCDLRGRVWSYRADPSGPRAPAFKAPHDGDFTLAEVEFLVSCNHWRVFGFFVAGTSGQSIAYTDMFFCDRFYDLCAVCFP